MKKVEEVLDENGVVPWSRDIDPEASKAVFDAENEVKPESERDALEAKVDAANFETLSHDALGSKLENGELTAAELSELHSLYGTSPEKDSHAEAKELMDKLEHDQFMKQIFGPAFKDDGTLDLEHDAQDDSKEGNLRGTKDAKDAILDVRREKAKPLHALTPDLKKALKLWERLVARAVGLLLDFSETHQTKQQSAMELVDRADPLQEKVRRLIKSIQVKERAHQLTIAQNHITGLLVQQAEQMLGGDWDALDGCEPTYGRKPTTNQAGATTAQKLCECAARNICSQSHALHRSMSRWSCWSVSRSMCMKP